MKQGYTIESYTHKANFASFLPGIAGVHGIPLWVFYVNRGQAISSFGIEHKNKSIMEFYPANKSFEQVTSHGFRTFIKVDNTVYEPFIASADSTQTMHIDINVLCIEDYNSTHDITMKVSYYISPNESFGSLVRAVSIQSGTNKNIEVIDGPPEILPSGIDTARIKDMSYTARAWAEVTHIAEGSPFYKAKTSSSDTEAIEQVEDGYFFISTHKGSINTHLIIDKDLVFEHFTDLSVPVGFVNNSVSDLLKKTQYTENKYSAGFATFQTELAPNNPLEFQSYYGYTRNASLLADIRNYLITQGTEYHNKKFIEAQTLTRELTKDISSATAFPLFDQYCEQNYIDNILRGGYPLVFQQEQGELVYHVYARKHGDLERDYNYFHLEARNYSQGNGNFRDICQNRRNDVLFHPKIKDTNALAFASLLQADGYNPLAIGGLTLSIDKAHIPQIESELQVSFDTSMLEFLERFTLGTLIEKAKEISSFHKYIQEHTEQAFLHTFVRHARPQGNAVFGEGFWVDHFSYILDLIETYLDIFPENVQQLLFATSLTYFDSPVRIASRKEKYIVKQDKVMQIGAVVELEEKLHKQQQRGHSYLVDENNQIYHATLFEKLFCLIVCKVSTLDVQGIGIEMEAGKPGWNDALNGMPGILGSGVAETIETLRIVDFLLDTLHVASQEITINKRIAQFAEDLFAVLAKDLSDIQRWDSATTLREQYREDIIHYIPSAQTTLPVNKLQEILQKYKVQLETGIQKSIDEKRGIPVSFIENIVSKYNIVEENPEKEPEEKPASYISIEEFSPRPIPLFLETPAKSLYVLNHDASKQLYQAIKSSEMYDKKLKMYRTSESLEQESIDIGRARSFAPGWLERESIFMHMEFKYLLSLLKSGLYQEFYQDFFNALPCFLDESMYGRSLLEASSFIVSSANANTTLHGRGYSARLSGSTAEVLSMWKILFLGHSLYEYKEGTLQLTLAPCLSAKLFPQEGPSKGIIKSKLFSHIELQIHNPNNIDTYTTIPQCIEVDGDKIEGNIISGELAIKIRNQEIQDIKIFY